MALRTDIASGDKRALYLAWLLGVQQGEIDDDHTEPARLNGLGTPSPALENFIALVGLDGDLVAAVVEGRSQIPTVPPVKEVDRWIGTLSERDKVVGSRPSRARRSRRSRSSLANRQADAWRRVETVVVRKRPGDDGAAIALLKDLREIGERTGLGVEIAARICALREAHAKKSSLLARLRKAGL